MDSQNIASLLSPIEGDNPCGIDLRESSSADYQTLKDARRTIASLVRARKFDHDADGEINTHWQTIYHLAPQVIKSQSKDLEVAAWFAEASLKLFGYAGLRAAFALNEGLVENFFDNLYPLPDEDGIETRVYPLMGLNGEDGLGTLILPLKNASLSENSDTPFSYNLYSRCLEADKISDAETKQQRFYEIGVTTQEITNQVIASSVTFYQNLIDDVKACLTHFNNMTKMLDLKCGLASSPPSSAIKKTLEAVLDAIKALTKTKLSVQQETSAPPHPVTSSQQQNNELPHAMAHLQSTKPASALNTREDALNQLLLVANYFRQAEPHSPLCGALERVVEWGNMSLQELMLVLIPDASARANYTQLTGINLGEDASPIGQLSQSAKVVPQTPTAHQDQTPKETEQTKDFGQSDNTNGW